jgi:hypothetical protein
MAGLCYAEHGYIGHYIWTELDKNPVGVHGRLRIYTFDQLLIIVRSLMPGSVWRHNQAGDLQPYPHDRSLIDRDKLQRLTDANKGRRGHTFTHYPMNEANQEAVAEAVRGGFMINLSANSLDHADELADMNIAPVAVVLPHDVTENLVTPKGRRVTMCPVYRVPDLTCSACEICTKPRNAIIGFPALGARRENAKLGIEAA